MSQIEDYLTQVANHVQQNKEKYVTLSHQLHEHPEIGNEERFACSQLTHALKEAGFEIKIDIATHPTGFIAVKDSHKEGPSIGILMEYDALKKIGHACGHNVIAMMSLGAALATASVMDELGGRLIVYGTPAEEGGPHGIRKINFEFFGRASHAAAAPEKGINALDAMILFYNGINAMRQQLPKGVLIHGVITDGGEAANIIPAHTQASFYIRAPYFELCETYKDKVIKIGEGAALATGCTFSYDESLNCVKQMLIIPSYEKLFVEEARRLNLEVKTKNCKSIGSTDAGNVSQVVPTIHPTIKICDEPVTLHTEAFKAAAHSQQADQAIRDGAIILSRIAVRLLMEPDTLKEIKDDFSKVKQNLR